MTPSKEQELMKVAPLLYRNMYGDWRVTCMADGIACSDGWYDIIYGLSIKLERLIEEEKAKAIELKHLPVAEQIKEKFGTLRFYLDNGTDEMYKLISEAEDLSEETCEICSNPGELRNSGWIKVKCDNCNNK